MKPYSDINGDSGVAAYEYSASSIRVQFKHGGTYEYQASGIGASNLNTMKRRADSGDGLNEFINTHPEVKNGCSSKF